MAWIYLAESAESPWPFHPGLDQSPTVRTIDTLKPFFCLGCDGGGLRLPQFGTTLPLSYKACCPEMRLISSLGDSPARTLVVQEMASVWKESEAGYFLRSSAWFASFDRHSFSWKMCQPSLFEGLTEFSWSSLRWGTIVDGRLYQPKKLEPRTAESDGSYLPTPTASSGGFNQSDSPQAKVRPSLVMMARKNLWPTPTASEGAKGSINRKFGDGSPTQSRAAAIWSPPNASDHKNRGGNVESRKAVGRQVMLSHQAGGQLNPTWVEWLMGYPQGWTVLEDWATLWFLSKRGRRSPGLSGSNPRKDLAAAD
jgi:hypothetical protein